MALMLVWPSVAVAEPPTLTKRKAETYVKRVINGLYGATAVDSLSRVCTRRTSLVRRCTVKVKLWGYTRYRGTMTVTRAGIYSSPVDTFTLRLRGVQTDADDIEETGRMIVETRNELLGAPLRLWVGDESQVDVTIGSPAEVVPLDEYGPPPGYQWIAFPVEAVNTGAGRFESRFAEARLVMDDGSTVERGYVPGCEPGVDMAGGEARRACLGFEIPAGAGWQQVEWDAGAETGVWEL